MAMRVFYFLSSLSLTFLFAAGDDPVNLPTIPFDSSKVTFFLYRKSVSKEFQIFIDDVTKLANSNFDPTLETFLFIHGYGGNHNKPPAQNVKNGILNAGDANVITVDYAPYNFPYRYLYNNSRMIGATTAKLIDFLVENGGLQLSKLVIIGHSFGAHISAFTANNVNGRIKQIVGLDPAGPLFRDVLPKDRLSQDDANYVVCIFTSPVLGINEPICTVNYFANGGSLQPSCATADDNEVLFGTCSHQVAIDYFVATLQSATSFPTSYCPAYDSYSHESYCFRQINSYMTTSYSKRPYPGNYYVRILSQ